MDDSRYRLPTSTSVMEDGGAALHALVEPRRAVALLVQRNRERLTTAVVDSFDERYVELFRMLRQVVRRGHTGVILTYSNPREPPVEITIINNLPSCTGANDKHPLSAILDLVPVLCHGYGSVSLNIVTKIACSLFIHSSKCIYIYICSRMGIKALLGIIMSHDWNVRQCY